MLPGDYTIQVQTGCGGLTYDFDIEVNPYNSEILQQSIVSTGTSTCSGGGTITSAVVYTGNFNNIVQLLDNSGNVIDSNTSGSFTNIPAGTYNTRLQVSTCTTAKYFVNNLNEIVISDGATGPQIIKKIGVVCEDSSGVPTSEGTVYLEISGASPLKVEYKLQTATSWTLFSNDAPLSLEINNLVPNETYDLRLTSCGKTATNSVNIQSPGLLSATNTGQPCLGDTYTLTGPDYAGASYQWTNPAGSVVSSTKDYFISTYNASHDGTYTLTVSWGGVW